MIIDITIELHFSLVLSSLPSSYKTELCLKFTSTSYSYYYPDIIDFFPSLFQLSTRQQHIHFDVIIFINKMSLLVLLLLFKSFQTSSVAHKKGRIACERARERETKEGGKLNKEWGHTCTFFDANNTTRNCYHAYINLLYPQKMKKNKKK